MQILPMPSNTKMSNQPANIDNSMNCNRDFEALLSRTSQDRPKTTSRKTLQADTAPGKQGPDPKDSNNQHIENKELSGKQPQKNGQREEISSSLNKQHEDKSLQKKHDQTGRGNEQAKENCSLHLDKNGSQEQSQTEVLDAVQGNIPETRIDKALQQALNKSGLNNSDLKQLFADIQIVEEKGQISLNKQQEKQLISFLGRLGMNYQQCRQMIRNINQGQFTNFLQKLHGALQNFEPLENFRLKQSELNNLLGLLGQKKNSFLTDKGQNLHNAQQNTDLNKQELNALQFLVQKTLTRTKEAQDRVNLFVQKMQKALAQETAQGRQTVPDRQELLKILQEAASNSGLKNQAGEKELFLNKAAGSENMQERFLRHLSSFFSANASENQNQGNADPGRGNNAWNEFWSKIKTVTRQTQSGLNRSEQQFNPVQNQLQSGSLSKVFADQSQNSNVKNNVLRQVQNGILRSLGNNGRELTLRLNPPQLGKLSLILRVQGNTVSALIRSNNHDVGRFLQHQVAGLQSTLEQQGLQVQKIEVQTELPKDYPFQQWLGENRHNQTREQKERMEKRNREHRLQRMLGNQEEIQELQEIESIKNAQEQLIYFIA